MSQKIEVKEFGWIEIKGERRSTHKVVIVVDGREFVRLFQPLYPVIWREEGETGFCDDKQVKDLEAIFKAWCLENNRSIDESIKQLTQ